MQSRSTFFFIYRLMLVCSILIANSLHAAVPLWSIEPVAGSNPTQFVPENRIGTVAYEVQNQSIKPKQIVMKSITGVTQTTPCYLAPKGQTGSNCILKLAIAGNALPPTGIHGGPLLCQANQDGSPNSNQCYQPSSANLLHITQGPTAFSTISVSPSPLVFVVGMSGELTVTNDRVSTEAAFDIKATIPTNSNISIQSTTCGESLAIGASCTITFTGTEVEGPVTVMISGRNTLNTINVGVTATQAMISVNPDELLFAENSTGTIEVTNSEDSLFIAENIDVSIPAQSNLIVQDNNCQNLAIGANCTITLASNTQEGPIAISIKGDNTNSATANVTVTNRPQISITGPVQSSRIVGVSPTQPLLLQINNSGASLVNANAITVSNKSSCPNLSVNDSDCISVVPGGNCTLELTSSTPYIPCTITISGSNTANSPTALVAFSYLDGLVFEENNGVGKVVNLIANDVMLWMNPVANVSGASDSNNGIANTNAIVNDSSSCMLINGCAAAACRAISLDWYLPAINELLLVNSVLCPLGSSCIFGDFFDEVYWSSTQQENTNNFAKTVTFPSGTEEIRDKATNLRYSCIRSFTM